MSNTLVVAWLDCHGLKHLNVIDGAELKDVISIIETSGGLIEMTHATTSIGPATFQTFVRLTCESYR